MAMILTILDNSPLKKYILIMEQIVPLWRLVIANCLIDVQRYKDKYIILLTRSY